MFYEIAKKRLFTDMNFPAELANKVSEKNLQA